MKVKNEKQGEKGQEKFTVQQVSALCSTFRLSYTQFYENKM